MILQIIEWLLGSIGNKILDFIHCNTLLIDLVFLVYILLIGISNIQLMSIKRNTKKLVLHEYLILKNEKKQSLEEQIYKKILPIWKKKIYQWGIFIPHKLEIYPVLVNEKRVRQKFDFSVDWIRTVIEFENNRSPK